jgi:hypothetical protein
VDTIKIYLKNWATTGISAYVTCPGTPITLT